MLRRLIRLAVFLILAALLVAAGFRLAATWRETETAQALMPEDGRLIETAEGAIFVMEYGPADGSPLLFLHGAGAWSGLWRPMLQEMAAEGYRAIALDMPPFGFSARDPQADYSRAAQARRVIALTAALDIRPVLVAHSFGAGPGVEAAMRAPDRFAGLVVVDGALGIGSTPAERLPLVLRGQFLREMIVANTATNPLLTRRLLASLIHVKAAASDQAVAVLQQPMRLAGSTAAFAQWLPFLLLPEPGALSSAAENYRVLCLPTVFLWGDQDRITPPAQGREAAALVPGAGYIGLPGAGHIPQIEAPEAFRAALLDALSRISGTGAGGCGG